MPLISCPICGKPISSAAPQCVRCGAVRGGSGAPRPRGTSPVAIIAIVAGVLFGGMMLVGILAAIAVPRFTNVARMAREAEGEMALRQVHLLQQGFHRRSGVYTADLDRIGWSDSGLRYYAVSVSEASEAGLCLNAIPRAETGEDLPPLSMDETGRRYRAAGCVEPVGPDLQGEWETGPEDWNDSVPVSGGHDLEGWDDSTPEPSRPGPSTAGP